MSVFCVLAFQICTYAGNAIGTIKCFAQSRRRMATWVNYLYPRERHAPLHILSGSPSTKGSKLLKVFLFSGSVAVSVSVSVPVSVSFSLSVSVSFSAFPLRGGVHSIVA